MSRVSPLSSFGPGNRTVIISRDTAVLFHHESSPRGQSVLLREEQADVHRRVFAGDCQAADPPPPAGYAGVRFLWKPWVLLTSPGRPHPFVSSNHWCLRMKSNTSSYFICSLLHFTPLNSALKLVQSNKVNCFQPRELRGSLKDEDVSGKHCMREEAYYWLFFDLLTWSREAGMINVSSTTWRLVPHLEQTTVFPSGWTRLFIHCPSVFYDI